MDAAISGAGAGPGTAPGPGSGSGAWTGTGVGAGTGTGSGAVPGSGVGTDEAGTRLQVSALQALCRQVFGFRLALIAVAGPIALVRVAPGYPSYLIGTAVVATFMGSYLLFRDWERFGPVLLRHPALLALDTLFAALLLVVATPDSPLAYLTASTPLLAGLVYGAKGGALFTVLQGALLAVVLTARARVDPITATDLLLPGFYAVAGGAGVSLRRLMLRFGAATRALTETQARLAVSEAVSSERARLAREMHDSVAKTLHGLALAADGLAATAAAGRPDPVGVRVQAELVGRAARRAAAESRELLDDLRRETGIDGHGIVLADELAARVADFGRRSNLAVSFRPVGAAPVPLLPPAVARQLLGVVGEALDNAARHAAPTRVDVEAGVDDAMLRISVRDDGRGLPPGTDLEGLRRAGHFGLVGMVERAAGIGARIRIGRGRARTGTEVRLELPVAALLTAAPAGLPLLPPRHPAAGGPGCRGAATGRPPEPPVPPEPTA
nr:histidine kinase [Streptomyces sp. SCUT-3]